MTDPPRTADPPLQGATGPLPSLRELYDRHAADIHRLAYRLTGSAADADDVVQDVFVGLPEALGAYREEGRIDAWLRRVAARVALARLRRETRRRQVPLDTAPPSATRGHQDAVVSQVTLQRALDQLPETLRVVLVLKELEGYTHDEIGEMLGIRPGASQVRHHRAHDKLRRILRSD